MKEILLPPLLVVMCVCAALGTLAPLAAILGEEGSIVRRLVVFFVGVVLLFVSGVAYAILKGMGYNL